MNKFFYYHKPTEMGVDCIIEVYQNKKENIDFNNQRVRILAHSEKNSKKGWFNVSLRTFSVWNEFMKEIKEEEIPAYKLLIGLQ